MGQHLAPSGTVPEGGSACQAGHMPQFVPRNVPLASKPSEPDLLEEQGAPEGHFAAIARQAELTIGRLEEDLLGLRVELAQALASRQHGSIENTFGHEQKMHDSNLHAQSHV